METKEFNIEVDKNDQPIGLRLRNDFYTGKYIDRTCQLLLLFNSENKLLLQESLYKNMVS